MKCYKPDGCGIYEGWNCADCPASRPEYAEQAKPAGGGNMFTVSEDLVRVVRCKDCKHMSIEPCGRYCFVWGFFNGAGDDGFCNYGERRCENG